MSISLESLKTSHTWTDGADNEQESVPFVKPHPPREPSADRIRRKPRVKSAGKDRGSAGKERSSAGAERTPHASSSRGNIINPFLKAVKRKFSTLSVLLPNTLLYSTMQGPSILIIYFIVLFRSFSVAELGWRGGGVGIDNYHFLSSSAASIVC